MSPERDVAYKLSDKLDTKFYYFLAIYPERDVAYKLSDKIDSKFLLFLSSTNSSNMQHSAEQKIIKFLKSVAKIIVLMLMITLVLTMLLGTIDLIIEVIKALASPTPYYALINVEDLYVVFSTILIIVVGYELFKSMNLLLHHDKIPVKSILQIAMIALANKVITLNIKTIKLDTMLGIGVIIAALGIAFFAFNKSNEKIE